MKIKIYIKVMGLYGDKRIDAGATRFLKAIEVELLDVSKVFGGFFKGQSPFTVVANDVKETLFTSQQ